MIMLKGRSYRLCELGCGVVSASKTRPGGALSVPEVIHYLRRRLTTRKACTRISRRYGHVPLHPRKGSTRLLQALGPDAYAETRSQAGRASWPYTSSNYRRQPSTTRCLDDVRRKGPPEVSPSAFGFEPVSSCGSGRSLPRASCRRSSNRCRPAARRCPCPCRVRPDRAP